MAKPPSTQWRETIGEDEEQRHASLSEEIVDIQDRVNRRQGPGRAFHRKQIAGLRARVEIVHDGSDELAQGMFAEQGAVFEARIRMSNGAMSPQPDLVPDVRGLAVSVRGVDGPGALGETTDRQDFLLINRPCFGFPDSREFGALLGPTAQGQAALARHFISYYGPVKGPVELARVTKDLFRPFTGFATATFHSAAPIKYGPYAVRVRLRPIGAFVRPLAAKDFAADIASRLRTSDLAWDLQVQFFTDEATTPIEDGRVDWPESESPYRTVAHVVVPQQDLDSDEGQAMAASVEADHFDPWSALADHRPLGEIMRARKVAYYPSVQHRT